jgi:hypothetical protein
MEHQTLQNHENRQPVLPPAASATDAELKNTRFYRDAYGEGREEGQEEGREKGVAEGEAALLLRQLERKFRPLPELARRRVAMADAETLLLWGERVLDAKSLDEVWGH